MATMLDTLRRMIEESDESLNAIGRGADVSPSQLSRFLHGERELTVETVERLLAHLGFELKIVRKRQRRKAK